VQRLAQKAERDEPPARAEEPRNQLEQQRPELPVGGANRVTGTMSGLTRYRWSDYAGGIVVAVKISFEQWGGYWGANVCAERGRFY